MENKIKEYLESLDKELTRIRVEVIVIGVNDIDKQLSDLQILNRKFMSEHFPIEEEHKCQPMVDAGWTILKCECGKSIEPPEVVKLKEKRITTSELKAFVNNWMNEHEAGTFIADERGDYMYRKGDVSLNLKVYFRMLLEDYINSTGKEIEYSNIISETTPKEETRYWEYRSNRHREFTKGKIYPFTFFDDNQLCECTDNEGVSNKWDEESLLFHFTETTLEAYKKQEEKEPKNYDFICPHSGEGFMIGDEYWTVYSTHLDQEATRGLRNLPYGYEYSAYFHKEQDALEWNRKKFVVKKEPKTLEQRVTDLENRLSLLH